MTFIEYKKFATLVKISSLAVYNSKIQDMTGKTDQDAYILNKTS